MKKILEILRRPRGGEAYLQSFPYELREPADTVATALTALNEEIGGPESDGRPARPIRWECACLQKRCGACAMLIDGRPALACAVKLRERGERIRLAPLRKFPVVEDLLVDRSLMFRNLREIRLWLEHEAVQDEEALEQNHEASRCLQCGCCLEVCPSFAPGEDFLGMAAALPLARILREAAPEELREKARSYEKHVYAGCAKSLACRDICPAKLPVEELLIRSNALAVWKFFLKRRKGG